MPSWLHAPSFPIEYSSLEILEGDHTQCDAAAYVLPSNFYCRCAHTGGLDTPPGSWRSDEKKTGGGSFIQLAVHFINLSQWILNKKIIRVGGISKNKVCKNIGGDDLTLAVAEYENGVAGTFESSYFSSGFIFSIYGSKGTVSIIDNNEARITLSDSFKGEVILYETPGKMVSIPLMPCNSDLCDHDQHNQFIQAIINNKQVPVGLDKGIYDLKVVKAVYKAAELGKFIEVR